MAVISLIGNRDRTYTDDQIKQWRQWHQKDLCCMEAKPGAPCVCRVQINCPVHGQKCVGTHD